MDLVALSNGLHGSVQMDSVALFSWIGWLRHHGIFNVKEKYLFSLIITGIGFVFVTILGCFSKSGFMETLIILSTALLLLALSLPFQLKEGNERGRIVLFVVVFGCTFLFAFLNQFIPKFFESIETILNTMDPTMFSVGLLITSFVLYFISMRISIHVYNKRILD